MSSRCSALAVDGVGASQHGNTRAWSPGDQRKNLKSFKRRKRWL
jgi:hypothetical protein